MSGSLRDYVLLCAVAAALCAAVCDGQTPPVDGTTAKNPFAALLTQAESEPEASKVEELPAEHPELAMETIVLKFLEAKSLKSVLDRMVTQYGTAAVNEKTNSIVVCDTPENLAKIMAEVKKADQTPRQIMIEVVMLDVQLRDDTEVGVNWDLLSDDLYDVTYRQNLTSTRLQSTIADEENIGNATAFNTVGAGGDFSLISGTVRNVLHALQQRRDVEILASPSTRVVSGQSATIKAVEEIPYEQITDTAQGGAGALTTTEFKEVGVNLQVSAVVTDGNNIFLNVDAEENVRTGESASGVPVVDTRHATTALLLQDGQTIVIGGLRRTEKTKEVSQIPILGDLPVIGLLFRSTTVVTNRSELVVLLSPHICTDEPVPSEILAERDRMFGKSLISARQDGTDAKKSEDAAQKAPDQ
ncbi:MAG: type II secretion system protein GspD [Solirubrobacterales bacterium]